MTSGDTRNPPLTPQQLAAYNETQAKEYGVHQGGASFAYQLWRPHVKRQFKGTYIVRFDDDPTHYFYDNGRPATAEDAAAAGFTVIVTP